VLSTKTFSFRKMFFILNWSGTKEKGAKLKNEGSVLRVKQKGVALSISVLILKGGGVDDIRHREEKEGIKSEIVKKKEFLDPEVPACGCSWSSRRERNVWRVALEGVVWPSELPEKKNAWGNSPCSLWCQSPAIAEKGSGYFFGGIAFFQRGKKENTHSAIQRLHYWRPGIRVNWRG